MSRTRKRVREQEDPVKREGSWEVKRSFAREQSSSTTSSLCLQEAAAPCSFTTATTTLCSPCCLQTEVGRRWKTLQGAHSCPLPPPPLFSLLPAITFVHPTSFVGDKAAANSLFPCNHNNAYIHHLKSKLEAQKDNSLLCCIKSYPCVA